MVDQERAIQLATGIYPEPGRYIRNPLRSDKRPGCWFEWRSGYLRLMDFADEKYHGANCFDLVCLSKKGHRITSDDDMKFVLEVLKENAWASSYKPEYVPFQFRLEVNPAPLRLKEKRYFEPFGISLSDLEEDGITGVESFLYNGRSFPDTMKTLRPQKAAICITAPSGHQKVYRPESEYKFTTNFNMDDYIVLGNGNVALAFEGYKDAKVAHVLGYTSIALHSSVKTPSTHAKITEMFDQVIYVGDCDDAGIKNGLKIVNETGWLYSPLPQELLKHGIKDLAQIRKEFGKERSIRAIEYILANASNDRGMLHAGQ